MVFYCRFTAFIYRFDRFVNGCHFLINLIFYLSRRNYAIGYWRLQHILESFPLWLPFFAILAIISGIWLLRRYDFSYKKNFIIIIMAFVLSIIISAWLINHLGINEAWSKQGRMRRFYQQLEGQGERLFINQGKMKNGGIRFFYD
jgi:hypothetical protein